MTRHVVICGVSTSLKAETVAPFLPDRVTIYAMDKSAGARRRVQALSAFVEASLGCPVAIGEGHTPSVAELGDAYALVTENEGLAEAARSAHPLLHVVPFSSAEREASTLFIVSADAVFRPYLADPDIVEQWTLENSEIAVNRHAPGRFALGDWDIRAARMHGVVGASWALALGADEQSAGEVVSRLPHTSEHGTIVPPAWDADDVANGIRHAADLISAREARFDRVQIVLGPQQDGFVEQMMDRLAWLMDVPVSCHVTSRLGIEERDVQALIPLNELTVPQPWTAFEADGPL
nr:hypothetical protein [Microbacterium barkeri]